MKNKKKGLPTIENWADKAKRTDFSELLQLCVKGGEDPTHSYKIYRVVDNNFTAITADSVLYISKKVSDIKETYGDRNVEYLIDFEEFANNYTFDDTDFVVKSLNHCKGY